MKTTILSAIGNTNRTLKSVSLMPLASLSICFFFVYYKVMQAMLITWWTDTMYSYCFLIPLLSYYMIWTKREALYDIPVNSNSLLGIMSILIGLMMLLSGHAGKIAALEQISIIPVIVGIALLSFGLIFLKNVWISIAYLLFMLPIWEFITDRLHAPFQSLSANIGVALIGSIGIPAYRHGVFLELPNVTLEVAKACSGINYVIAVAALAVPMAQIFLTKWNQKIFLVTSSIVIAILANGLRVALIGILSHYGITKEIHGPNHILHGIFVSFVGYAAIFGGLWLMTRKSQNNINAPITSQDAQLFPEMTSDSKIPLTKGAWISVIVLLVTTGCYINFYKVAPVHLKTDFKFFPDKIEYWTAIDLPSGSSSINASIPDGKLLRVYDSPTGGRAVVNVTYLDLQDDKKKLVSLERDMITLLQISAKTTINLGRGRQITVNKALQHNPTGNKIIYFWYDINGRIITNPILVKAYTIRDYFISGRNNGAFIMVSFNGEGEVLSEQRFLSELCMIMNDYLP